MIGGGARKDHRPGKVRIERARKREVNKTADWIINLGPEGGDKGGEIVAEGTPKQVAEEPRSYTIIDPAHPEERSTEDESESRRKPKKARRGCGAGAGGGGVGAELRINTHTAFAGGDPLSI